MGHFLHWRPCKSPLILLKEMSHGNSHEELLSPSWHLSLTGAQTAKHVGRLLFAQRLQTIAAAEDETQGRTNTSHKGPLHQGSVLRYIALYDLYMSHRRFKDIG